MNDTQWLLILSDKVVTNLEVALRMKYFDSKKVKMIR